MSTSPAPPLTSAAESLISEEKPSGFGIAHSILVRIAYFAVDSFFHEIKIVGAENITYEEGAILACSHSNMALDPACLSYGVIKAAKGNKKPYIHYWAKNTLFANPIFGAVLLNAGNIPVDRKTKNNQILFRGSFEAFDNSEVIGVFPEGTSHHNSRLIPFKDGTAWTALEYLTYLEDHKGGAKVPGGKPGGTAKPAKIIPVGITYSNKTKYRSRVVVEYGKPISMDKYSEEFLSRVEGAPKAAVKRLTARIEDEILKLTVNGEDWDSLNAAQMARELLWDDEEDLGMEHFKEVSQTLVDLLSHPTPSAALSALKSTLISYHSYLSTSRLTNSALSAIHVPLPSSLDPSRPIPVPSRLATLWILIKQFIGTLVRLPFFALPFIINIPLYLVGNYGTTLAADEMESVAQMKLALGVIGSLLIYPVIALTLFFAVFRTDGLTGTLVGLGLASLCVWGLAMYHLSLIDDNYKHFRNLVAAFRILIGIWSPLENDLVLPSAATPPFSRSPSFGSLINTTTPTTSLPPASALLPPAPLAFGRTFPHPSTASTIHKSSFPHPYEPNKPSIPSRRLIRQVLRTRLLASKALEAYLVALETTDGGSEVVPSSYWLATTVKEVEEEVEVEGVKVRRTKKVGTREGREVVELLRRRGARVVLGEAGKMDTRWLEMLEERENGVEGKKER